MGTTLDCSAQALVISRARKMLCTAPACLMRNLSGSACRPSMPAALPLKPWRSAAHSNFADNDLLGYQTEAVFRKGII